MHSEVGLPCSWRTFDSVVNLAQHGGTADAENGADQRVIRRGEGHGQSKRPPRSLESRDFPPLLSEPHLVEAVGRVPLKVHRDAPAARGSCAEKELGRKTGGCRTLPG